MICPPYLKKGDKIGVVSTAKRVSAEEIEKGISVLRSWELEPVLGKNCFNTHHFFAGMDTERLADLQQMLDDESIKAIIFTKGGYGTLRIIDQLNFSGFKRSPKWLAGYSDITILHNQLSNMGFESIHSVMLQGMNSCTEESTTSLYKALFGETLFYEFTTAADNKNPKAIEGILCGGNLSIIYSLQGSATDIDTTDCILFFEDIDEYLYHFERMLLALKRNGKLEKLKGILVGGLTDIKDPTIPYGFSAHEIIVDTVKEYDFPVYFNFPAGHINDNRALILGKKIRISPFAGKVRVEF